jgi:nicotinate-nucleotide pyrophosphorylase (carboxylating)
MNPLVKAALAEDLGRLGDVTTTLFVPTGARLKGRVVSRQTGVICGTKLARDVFRAVDPGCRVTINVPDGRPVRPGQQVMEVYGGRGLLTAERTALNFLQHLCGVATLTARFVAKARGTRARIYDTRKTLPGWRALEKYAVRCGGGVNHRMGLHDAVMLKDNHWAAGGDVAAGVRALRRRHPGMPLIIEADTLSQAKRALELEADVILLDNMGRSSLKRAIALIRRTRPKTQIEISGGVSLETARGLARLGPDRISIGRLTHSAPALDLGLDLDFT